MKKKTTAKKKRGRPPRVLHARDPFARWLRAQRLAADITASGLARRVGTNQTAVYRWEYGIARPSGPSLAAIVAVLGVPPDSVLRECDPWVRERIGMMGDNG